jgi:adenosylcobinamide kinase/adenosylcobinamide-phosphate guanylyltransferase
MKARWAKPAKDGHVASLHFVIGGARSGKSAFAEGLALEKAGTSPITYVATAEIFDDEMADRVALHQQRRGPQWHLVEAPVDLAAAIPGADTPDSVLLIDCLSVWVTNLLVKEMDIDTSKAALLAALQRASGTIVLVASETGLGIVPDNRLSRQFRDANGRLNQALAGDAHEVFFVVAGIASKIKTSA